MEDIIKLANDYIIPFYKRYDVIVKKGKKHWVWDINGEKYLDFTSGISVVNFGHCNKYINKRIKKQLGKIIHISNLYYIPEQIEVAEKLTKIAFEGKVFFCNSGAEANEAAIKISRIYGNMINPNKNKILSLKGSFHGRTIATISLTGQDKYKKGFEPLLENIDFVNYNDTNDLKNKFDDNVCAIFLEAIQGEGGVRGLSQDFVFTARELCNKYNALMVFDEVQCGIGRTGRFFGYQNLLIEPDVITLAKSLGNGIPIGLTLVKKEISDKMPAGMHASTFGGNFIACAAASAVLDLLDEILLNKINELSNYFSKKLDLIKDNYQNIIKQVRIYGLMIGIEFTDNYNVVEIINKLLNKKILTIKAGENVLRLLPPFTISEKEIDIFCENLDKILKRL